MNKLRRLAAFVLLAAALALAQVPVAIRTDGAKARKSPNSHAQVLATLHKGEMFVVQDDLPYWYGITLKNGKAAYVRKSACTIVGEDDLEEQPGDLPSAQPVAGVTVHVAECTPTEVPTDWNICPEDGSGGKYAQAYIKKNRHSVPCDYAAQVTVDDMLALSQLPAAVRALPDGDSQLEYLKQMESKAVVLEGYLALAKDGGLEGVNCKDPDRLDTHLELADNDTEDPKTNRPRHVIVEVTPWLRSAIPAWTTQALGEYASYLQGYQAQHPTRPPTKVRIYGYLFYDEAHASGASAWRGTAWEVHPITRIEVFVDGQWKEIK